jgi:methylenetetrahydrofolate dehydrogenase (NADP+)/methenyltetrahydrofolate cyclohydrolase
MIIDGKKIAEDIKNSLKEEIKTSGKKLKLAIVQVGENEVSQKFIERKVKFAEEIGVKTKVYNLPADISTSQLRKKIAEICHIKENDGVILQLPLPEHINTQYALNGIISKKDVDVLSSRAFGDFAAGRSKILPPLVGVIKIIFEKYSIEPAGKNIVVVGRGILVGKPIANWLINEGATVSVLNSKTRDISEFTKEADIIISGVGKPNLIKAEMVKDGIIIIDAGTSMEKGKIAGDVALEVAQKSSLFTPVPGGVGPITVAMVFKNLVELSK